MAKLWLGPVGSISTGHVLDCAKAPLERRLRDYDSRLYAKWNPRKLKGHGVWEIRYRPEFKTIRRGDVVQFQGQTYMVPKWHETNLVNHVMDTPYLNYHIFEKLKQMDTWTQNQFGEKGKNFGAQIEYLQAKHEEKIEDDSLNEREYNLKQMKSEIRWFKEYILSGGNPAEIASVWDKS